jgi:hypothetical protein
LVLLALCTPARAREPGDIARAQALYDGLKFEAAERAIAEALARPGRGPAELAALYRLRGLLSAARDDDARAQADFTRWLALEPSGQLPPGVAPKIVAPFLAAFRTQQRRPPLALRPALRGGTLRIEVVGDPLRMGQAVLVHYALGGHAAGELRADLPGAPAAPVVELALPPGARRPRYIVELLGEHGGRLAQAGSLAAPLSAERRSPLYRRWWLWTAVGGAAAIGLGLGLGLGFGLNR